jgi:hypothetical protein
MGDHFGTPVGWKVYWCTLWPFTGLFHYYTLSLLAPAVHYSPQSFLSIGLEPECYI